MAAQRGAAGIVICRRGVENGEGVAAKLREIGSQALYVQADLQEVAQSMSGGDYRRQGEVWAH